MAHPLKSEDPKRIKENEELMSLRDKLKKDFFNVKLSEFTVIEIFLIMSLFQNKTLHSSEIQILIAKAEKLSKKQ